MKTYVFSILFFGSFYTGLAQENLSMHLLNVPASISPNTHFSLFFEVQSPSPFVDSVYARLTLPDGWNTLIAKNPQKVIGQSAVRYIYTVATAHITPSGSYPISISVYNGSTERIRKTITVHVTQARRIEVTPISVPEYLLEGDSLKVEYMIQNSGNNTEKVWVESSNTSGKRGHKGDSLTILPGENIRVNTTQKVPVSDGNSWTISPKIKVFMRDSIDPIMQILSVPVYSKKNKKNDPYLRFPLEVGVGYSRFVNNAYSVGSYQYDVRGRGFLDFKQNHYLDFIVHGPNQFNMPMVSSYSQYSLAYTYRKNTTVQLGDYLLAFNNLMEFGRFGRGAKFDRNFTKTSFSVFYLQPRFYFAQKATFGGRFTYRPQEKSEVSFNYLAKNVFAGNHWFWANFAGTSLNLKTNALHLETEVALGIANSKIDFGAFNRLNFHYKKLQFTNNLIYAGKNFYGFFNNSWQLVNSINYSLSKKIGIGLINNITRVNPGFDILFLNTSPYYSNHTALLSYAVNSKHRIILSYNRQEKEDRQLQKEFYYRENYVQLGYYINTEKFNLIYDGRYGYSENLLNTVDNHVRGKSISNLIQPQTQVFRGLWLSVFGEHQYTNKFSSANQLTNYLFYGGSARANVNKHFSANLTYRNKYAPDELIGRRTFMDLSVNCTLGNSKLSLTGSKVFIPNYTQTDQNTLFFLLKYTLTLNTPLAKNRNLGHIKGQILGLTEAVKKEGIMVQLGNKKYVTDANGVFYFNDLMPDKYYLTLDKSSLSSGAISAIKTPIEVNVSADSTKTITIPLLKSGGLEGNLNFVLTDEEKAKKQNPVILVKIFNENESFLTKANDKNAFSFKEIKPGNWKIKAWFPDEQNLLTIENAEQSIMIKEGVINKMAFNVLATKRKIHFSNTNYQVVMQQ